jgi:hypothetical protein
MGKTTRGRYRGVKGSGFYGTSEYDGTESEASLDEAFEQAAAAVQDAIDDDGEPDDESLFDADFDAHIEIRPRRHNQNVKVYKVVITTPPR